MASGGENNPRPLVIGFEGNIGAGKTTLIRNLAKSLGERCFVFWDAALKCPHLEKFYEDRSAENCYRVQKWVADERRGREYPDDVAVILVDRTAMSDTVFTLIGADRLGGDRTIELLEMARRTALVERPDFLVFLDTKVDECLANIDKRGRPMEGGIDSAYLQKIADAYETELKLTGLPPYAIVPLAEEDASWKFVDALLLRLLIEKNRE